MGCFYSSSTFSLLQTELLTEINTSRNDLLNKKRISSQSTVSSQKTKQSNLYSSPKMKSKDKYSNYNKSLSLDVKINNTIENRNKGIPRLSIQKINELFDDSNIKCNLIKSEKDYYQCCFLNETINNTNCNINNKEQNLNSTYEQTLKTTINSEY